MINVENEDGIAGSVTVGKFDLTTYETSSRVIWITVNSTCPDRSGEGMEVHTDLLENALNEFFKEHI